MLPSLRKLFNTAIIGSMLLSLLPWAVVAEAVNPSLSAPVNTMQELVIDTTSTDTAPVVAAQIEGAFYKVLAKPGQLKVGAGVELWHDYGSFALYKVSESAYNSLSAAQRTELTVDSQMDVLLYDNLNFNTQTDSLERLPTTLRVTEAKGSGLHLIQFVGPIKDEWLKTVREAGATPIHYVANYGYLVWADDTARANLNALAVDGNFVQASLPYQTYFKLGESLLERVTETEKGTEAEAQKEAKPIPVTVQIYDHPNKDQTVRLIQDLALKTNSKWASVLDYQNIVIEINPADILTIASRPDVVWVGERFERERFDEIQNQVLAGNSILGNTQPSGTGYLAWLDSYGFSQDPADYPVVAVVDDGVGDGNTANGAGDDTLTVMRDGTTSRLEFVSNCTSEASGEGLDGHGHINASIVGGYDVRAGFPFRDPNGYQRGLGVNPYGTLASTRIFNASALFDLSSCGGTDTGLIEHTYTQGAQISTNSWGCSGCAFQYDDSSQAFDAGTRDADSVTAGNQELIHLFAAGNSGSGAGTIGTPGNGKNMITVGASENYRPTDEDGNWTDGCFVGPTGADSFMDIINFSSRGPAPGNRVKPEVIAPGTHIQGTASTNGSYNGSGVCDQFRPSAQTVFAASSGTSHSTPAVAGVSSLYYYWLENEYGITPSPAMMKAYLMAHTTYLTGTSANDNLPSNNQGYGMPNMAVALDDTNRYLLDQSELLDNTGETFDVVLNIADPAKPVFLVMAYTDKAGAIGTSPQVNNLDLMADLDGTVYHGNNFTGYWSDPGGTADANNNYEAIFLPAGSGSVLTITVQATNIADDGVPNIGDATDQDFALVCYNCSQDADFTLSATPSTQAVCAPATADYGVLVGAIDGYVTTVNLTAVITPSGPTASFSPATGNSPYTATMTVDPATATAGTYMISAVGTGPTSTHTSTVAIDIYTGFPTAPSLLGPVDGAVDVVLNPVFAWAGDGLPTEYHFELARDAGFVAVVYETTTDGLSVTYPGMLDENSTYYWRVTPTNLCGEGAVSEVNSFTTSALTTIEGTITDGTTGWPLYAMVNFSADVGSGTAYSNPATGYYSFEAYSGYTYTLNVASVYAGYVPMSTTVAAPLAGATADGMLYADAVSCTAPGYELGQSYLFEDFETWPITDTWTIVDNAGSCVWQAGSIAGQTNTTGGSGDFADANSDFCLGGMDTDLISPPMDLSGATNPVLTFQSDMRLYSSDVWEVDLSLDGGLSWTNIFSRSGQSYRGPELIDVPLTAAVGITNAHVRFNYYAAGWDYWWQVDDVAVFDAVCSPVSGGLVIGNTYDLNTTEPVNDASVMNEDGYLGMSIATPDDDNVEDGFYYAFSPAGTKVFSATAAGYGYDTVTVSVAQSTTTWQDFYLSTGILTATPESLAVTVAWGASDTLKLDLFNSGSTDVDIEFGEAETGFTLLSANADVLLLGDDVNATGWQAYRDALSAAGVAWHEWDIDSLSFPSSTDLEPYKTLIWFDNNVLTPGDAEFQIVVDWLDTGGKNIFVTSVDFLWDIENGDPGGGENNMYQRLNTTYEGDYAGTGIAELEAVPGANIGSANLALSLNGDSSGDYASLASPAATGLIYGPGGSGSGFSALTYQDTGDYKSVWLGVNFHNGLANQTDRNALMSEIMTFFGGDVLWLSEDPVTDTVTANSSASYDITFDSDVESVTQPGDYYANLIVNNSTPYGAFDVPVTMTVLPPADWGKLDGTVSSLGYCDNSSSPLAETSVFLTAAGFTETVELVTDANGYFAYWTDVSNSPITLTVDYPDHLSEVVNGVTLTDGMTTTQDINLRLLAPCVNVAPDMIYSAQISNTIVTKSLTISNTGALTFSWNVTESTNVVNSLPEQAQAVTASGDATQAADTASADTASAGEILALDPNYVHPMAQANQLLYDNGPLVNSPGTGAGGADESVLQNSSLGMDSLGLGHQVSAGNRIADDFVVPSEWTIDTITFYAYQTGSSLSSTITAVNLRIWDGPPNDPSSNIVFGDDTTNRLVSTEWTGIYRVLETSSGNTDRPIMANEVAVGTTLDPGTYWLDWQVDGSLASGPWAPPITINGETTTGNALQSLSGVWQDAIDGGTLTAQGFPFQINGLDTACSGDIGWASVSPLSGTLGPAGLGTGFLPSLDTIDVMLDSTGLTAGELYQGSLCLFTDDPQQPLFQIPVEMLVLDDAPAILLDKTANADSTCVGSQQELVTIAGTDVTYCYEVFNSGNLTFTTHSLLDDQLGLLVDSVPYTLGVGSNFVFSSTTLLDTLGQVVNTAVWTATDGVVTVTDSDVLTVTTVEASLAFTKTVGTEVGVCATTNSITVTRGDSVTHCFMVENTGDVTFTNHHVWDEDYGTIFSGSHTLAPGDVVSMTATVVVTTDQSSLGYWEAHSPEFDHTVSVSGTNTVNVLEPEITIAKTVGVDPDTCASTSDLAVFSGTEVYYCLTVENTGDFTFTYHYLSDPALGVEAEFAFSLAPGAVVPVTNEVLTSVLGLPPVLGPVVITEDLMNTIVFTAESTDWTASDSSTASVIVVNPSINITKTVGTDSATCATTNDITIANGTDVYYCLTIENTGDYTLTQHTLSDPALGLDVTFPFTLAPGAVVPVTNEVLTSVLGLPAAFGPVALIEDTMNTIVFTASQSAVSVSDSSSAMVNVVNPSISVTKTVGTEMGVCASDSTLTVTGTTTVYYCYTVQNTGDITLPLHSLVDSDLGALLGPDFAYDLAPGASVDTVAAGVTISTSLSVTTTNVATWTAYVDDSISAMATAEATVNVLPEPMPSITLAKTVGTEMGVCAGDSTLTVTGTTTVYYCYTVTNGGNTTLTHHDLVDDQLGSILSGFAYDLAPGTSVDTVAAGLTLSATLEMTTTNIATWTAYISGTEISAMATNMATVNVLPDTPVTPSTPTIYLPIVLK